MKLYVFSSFVALLTLGGCASQEADTADSEIGGVAIARVSPGAFRLFDAPNHVADPQCESFTDLSITEKGASLANGLGGKCALTAMFDPDMRSYSLHAAFGPCGSTIYTGARRVPLGPSTTGIATIKITDHRLETCDVAAPAAIVVEETVPGFPGAITTTMYSHEVTAPEEVVACRELVDHGAVVRFLAGKDGVIARAVYTETSFFGTEVVADMNVCFAHEQHPQDDGVYVTHSCNDVSWVDGHSVELSEGGFTGMPSASIFAINSGGQKVLLKTLPCHRI
jgi:hypothetical protein